MISEVHVIALVKGTVEGDPCKHFGSLLGISGHKAAAMRLGLLCKPKSLADCRATQAGRKFYVEAHLSELPDGRANHWGTKADRAIEMLREMEG